MRLAIKIEPLTWHKKLFPKLLLCCWDQCIPSPFWGQRILENKPALRPSHQCQIAEALSCHCEEWLLLLTVLQHADECDDDQKVDVLHHHHFHDRCEGRCKVSGRTVWWRAKEQFYTLQWVFNHSTHLLLCKSSGLAEKPNTSSFCVCVCAYQM